MLISSPPHHVSIIYVCSLSLIFEKVFDRYISKLILFEHVHIKSTKLDKNNKSHQLISFNSSSLLIFFLVCLHVQIFLPGLGSKSSRFRIICFNIIYL